MVTDHDARTQLTEFSFILAPSHLGGIGVFAAHDIDKGTPLAQVKFTKIIRKKKDIPSDFLRYCIFINDEECWCPERFDRMEIGWYVNHSHHSNIGKINDVAYVLRDVKKGEEILMDYNELDEPEHLKEKYYIKPSP